MAMGDQTRPGMWLEKWTPHRKNALRGFADVRLRNSLVIYSCSVWFAHGRAWATLPGKPQIGRDGLPIKIDGRLQYAKIIQWGDQYHCQPLQRDGCRISPRARSVGFRRR